MKLDWESGIGRQEAHRASQTLPEGALQMRPLLKGCLETLVRFPLPSPSNAVAGVRGHWRRAPCGGRAVPAKRRRRATLCNFSEVIVETPTGDTCPD